MRGLVPAALGGVMLVAAGNQSFSQTLREPVKCEFGKGKFITEGPVFKASKLHEEVEMFKLFDANCDGVMQPAELRAYDEWIVEKSKGYDAQFARTTRGGGQPPAIPFPKRKEKPIWSSQLVLRDSFEDLGAFSEPKPAKLASGATFGYTRDQVLNNISWAAKGVLAFPISYSAPTPTDPRQFKQAYLSGFAFTPTFGFQKNSNSNATVAKKNDVDVLTLGAGAEFAFDPSVNSTTTHYFRVRSAEVMNFEGVGRSWNVIAEYQPLTVTGGGWDIGSPNSFFNSPVTWQLDAILRGHFARRQGDLSDPLFDQRDNVYRLGPVLALSILPFQSDDYDPFLRKINFTAAYSWLKGLNNGQSYNHFITSLGYDFEKDGKLGVKISYETGKVEETAQDVKTTKVGLTAKF